MKIASVADVKAKLSSYLSESASNPVVVTRNGKAVAVLLGVENDDELERILLANSRRLRDILDAANQRIEAGGGIPKDEFWKQVEARNRSRQRKRTGKSSERSGNRRLATNSSSRLHFFPI